MDIRPMLLSVLRSLCVGFVLAGALVWVFVAIDGRSPPPVATSARAPIPFTPSPALHREWPLPSLGPARPSTGHSYGLAVQGAIDIQGSDVFSARCNEVLPLVGGLSFRSVYAFCSLASPFDSLMRVRYARAEMDDSDHATLCAEARSRLQSARVFKAGVQECGEVSGELLAWTDEAWLGGCIDTREWSGAYRDFQSERAGWDAAHDPVCQVTASAWASTDQVESPPSLSDPDERWAARVDALGWSRAKLCTPPIQDHLRAEQEAGKAPLLFMEDEAMAALALECIEASPAWVPLFPF